MDNVFANLYDGLDEGRFARALLRVSQVSSQTSNAYPCVILPDDPAKSSFIRPSALPLSVNGLRSGIVILGIISCDMVSELALSVGRASSSSSPEATAWQLRSSAIEISSRCLVDWLVIDLGLLGRDDGSSGFKRFNGVKGRGDVNLDKVNGASSLLWDTESKSLIFEL